MITAIVTIHHALRTTALCSLAALCFIPLAALAFDPDEDSDTAAAVAADVLPAPMPENKKPVYSKPARMSGTAPVKAPPRLATTIRAEANAAPRANFDPMLNALPPVIIPPRGMPVSAPVTPAAAVVKAPIILTPPAPEPAFPPVDAVTHEAAKRVMEAPQPAPAIVASSIAAAPAAPSGFIAPAPLVALPPPAPGSIAAPAPREAAPLVPSAPATLTSHVPAPRMVPVLQPLPTAPDMAPQSAPLSDATQNILSKVPSKLDTAKPQKAGKLSVSRMNPSVLPVGKSDTNTKVETYDAVGLSIKVQRPGLDSNFELNRAYTALMGGQTEQAIEIYKNILSTEPKNEDALFGLGATYQRLGQLDKARPYYGKLLEINPNHRAGLNNFLAMVSEESPDGALAELERLEQRNPDFSPIPAQQALVLNKLGYPDRAKEKILRAIELSPENMVYRYNLAVLLDTSGHYAQAVPLYRQLIDASLKGEKLPASTETLQKRLNYIATVMASKPPAMN